MSGNDGQFRSNSTNYDDDEKDDFFTSATFAMALFTLSIILGCVVVYGLILCRRRHQGGGGNSRNNTNGEFIPDNIVNLDDASATTYLTRSARARSRAARLVAMQERSQGSLERSAIKIAKRKAFVEAVLASVQYQHFERKPAAGAAPGAHSEYNDNDDADDDHSHSHQDECAICLCPFDREDVITHSSVNVQRDDNVHACPHYYHRDCMINWLIVHRECPVCRRIYLQADYDAALAQHARNAQHLVEMDDDEAASSPPPDPVEGVTVVVEDVDEQEPTPIDEVVEARTNQRLP